MPFEYTDQNDYAVINLNGEFKGDETPSIHTLFQEKLKEKQIKFWIFNAADCGNMEINFLRQLAGIYKDLKAINGAMRIIEPNKKVSAFILSQGLDKILVTKQSLRGALVDFGLATEKQLDVNFINPFLSSTQKVFKVQCFLEATAQKPYLKKNTDPLLLGDVSGVISISSETFNGTLAISLTEKIFCKIGSNMLNEDFKEINEKNIDLVGELANMILGQAKIELGKLGYGIQMAIPSCVWGKDHKIKHFGGGVCVVIPFETPEGTFYTEIMTKQI